MSKQTFTTGQVLTAAQMTSLQQTAMGGGSTTAKTASYVLVAADAGTVVQMNAAGATTITVNTALFAAGDSVQIQNIGAGVCTITAGTATVSTAGSLALSQYEGGQLYFNTTSAALFFDIVQSSGMTNPMTTTGDIIYSSSGSTPARLGIGTTGQVLNVASGLPAWATPASGSTYVGCSVSNSVSQNIADSTETAVTFDTEQWDTNAIHTTVGVNTSRFTVPAGYAGKWSLTGGFPLTGVPSQWEFYIYVNGAYFITGYPQFSRAASSGRGTDIAVPAFELNLAVADYVQVYAWHNFGSTTALRMQYGRAFFSYIGA